MRGANMRKGKVPQKERLDIKRTVVGVVSLLVVLVMVGSVVVSIFR